MQNILEKGKYYVVKLLKEEGEKLLDMYISDSRNSLEFYQHGSLKNFTQTNRSIEPISVISMRQITAIRYMEGKKDTLQVELQHGTLYHEITFENDKELTKFSHFFSSRSTNRENSTTMQINYKQTKSTIHTNPININNYIDTQQNTQEHSYTELSTTVQINNDISNEL